MKEIKIIFISFWGMLSSALGILFVPTVLLIFCNILDYITGLMATPKRNKKINSYKSIKGIIRKVTMWLLIAVGVIIDQVIIYSASTLGISFSFTFLISSLVAVWLVCNELISILENIVDIGIPLPGFLEKVIYYIKGQVENKPQIDSQKKKE